MTISLIQIILILFALFAWSRAFLRLRSKDVNIGEFIFWSCIWIAVVVVGLFPASIGGISTILGIGRAVDLVIYVSVILLFYLLFRLYVKVDSHTQEITKLVREIAISNAKQKNNKKK